MVGLAVTASQMENVPSLGITKTNLERNLKSQFGNNVNFTITDNGDGSFMVRFDDTDRMYYVESSGKVIENDNILKISTANELKTFRDDVNSGDTFEGKVICLTNNIEIEEIWVPIGNEERVFKGTFIGDDYNVKINTSSQEDDIGLFGVNYGNIYTLNISGDIVSNDFIGGICGKNYGNIANCSSSAKVESTSSSSNPYVGGIVGRISNSNVFNCYNIGKIINTKSATGGIIAQTVSISYIKNCYNIGEIVGNSNTGGIIGILGGTIENCYNFASVTGNGTKGGIMG